LFKKAENRKGSDARTASLLKLFDNAPLTDNIFVQGPEALFQLPAPGIS
jgi:hypothetical protein